MAEDRGQRLGIGQGRLEDLDARGALQPVAFAGAATRTNAPTWPRLII
jgi:hypothetical protein